MDKKKSSPDSNESDLKKVQNARQQADRDMEDDAELTAQSPNDDLDEEEAASRDTDHPIA